jgi:hypothetical protein
MKKAQVLMLSLLLGALACSKESKEADPPSANQKLYKADHTCNAECANGSCEISSADPVVCSCSWWGNPTCAPAEQQSNVIDRSVTSAQDGMERYDALIENAQSLDNPKVSDFVDGIMDLKALFNNQDGYTISSSSDLATYDATVAALSDLKSEFSNAEINIILDV